MVLGLTRSCCGLVVRRFRSPGSSPRSIDLEHSGRSLCFFFIGLADDLFALSPWPRLAGQVAALRHLVGGCPDRAIDLPWFSSTA